MSQATAQDFVEQQQRLNERRKKLHPILRRLVPLFARLDVEGLDNVPQSGPTLLMGNHISLIDPIFFTVAVQSRYVVSMAKAETLENPIQHWALKTWGNFVVNRGNVDRMALKQAIELIRNDQLLWIAPEGTRNPQGLGEARSGVSYIAHKSNAIIVPSAICGAQDWAKCLMRLRRVYARVIFGQPFRLCLPEGERLSREVREQMITEAMYQLARTIPDEYAEQRGLYTDMNQATTHYLEFVRVKV
ncbi:MAG: lysophospholipid acyltransferase family protein [Anaerolineae bacterium]